MTLEELNEHHDLLDRLRQAVEMRDALMSAACPGAQNLSGMPHATGVSDKIGDLAVEIADLDTAIEHLENEIAKSEAALSEWISGIDNTYTKIIFRLRFIRGMQWKEVAGIIGKYKSEESVKHAVYRYLE